MATNEAQQQRNGEDEAVTDRQMDELDGRRGAEVGSRRIIQVMIGTGHADVGECDSS